MSCIFRPRLNSLWSIWYTILILLINTYLIYLGFTRYQLYTEIKWPHGSYPNFWLTVYICLYGACIPLMVLFFAFGIFKTGNLAGDNDKIANRFERIIELTRVTRESCCAHFWKSFWMHGPPLPQTIHIIFALCQMLAQQVMLAQLYRFGFINVGDFLNTEMDFIFQRARQLATNLPMGDTRLQGFKITTEELAGSPLAPNILPVLMHARLFGIPLEFVNLIIGLIFYSISYPSVFYRINKSFSLIFSFHLLFLSTNLIFTYFGFCILFRIQETNFNSIRPIGLGQYLPGNILPKIFFHPMVILYSFIGSIIVLMSGSVIVYSYGHQKYLLAIKTIQNKNKERTTNINEYTDYRQRQSDPYIGLCCNGYGPNALAICYLIVLAIIKCPTIGGIVEIYDHEQRSILLTCLLVDTTYLFFWIILWIILTCQNQWGIKILHSVNEILNLQSAHKLGFGTIAGKTPSELKNALFMMCEDHMYVTDDPLAKQSLMRHALKTTNHDEVYLLRGNQSPIEKRVLIDDSQKPIRLIENQRQNINNTMTLNRSPILTYQQSGQLRNINIPSQNMTDDRFGTFNRQQYAPGMLNYQAATLGRNSSTNLRHPESYATINRNVKPLEKIYDTQRVQTDMSNNSQYASYSRMHIPRGSVPNQPILSNSSIYESRQASEPIQRGMNETGFVKASPLLNDKRDIPSHYQKSNLSSFNGRSNPNGGPRLLPTGQLPYSSNKPTVSASSSQQDSCFTPTTPSVNNGSSNASTTACSPNDPNVQRPSFQSYRYDDTRGGSEPHGTHNYGTLTKSSISASIGPRISSGSIRMPIKSTTVSITQRHDDSANFSLSSSNDSDGNRRMAMNNHENDYATSVV